MRRFDPATGFYTGELDSGVVRRSVLYRDMRVVYALRDDEGLPWSTPPAEGASYLDWLFQSPARARLALAVHLFA